MTLTIRGITYHVAIGGDPKRERAAILLHGFTGSGEDWDGVVPMLREAGVATVAVDLVGHGGTGVAVTPTRYAMPETVRDLTLVLDALSIERADWIGYSMGGRVALHFALASPARVRTLILESASPGIADAEAREERHRGDDTLARHIEERGMEWFADYWTSLPLFATQASLPLEVRATQHARRLRNDAVGLARSLRGMGQGAHEYVGDQLTRLHCPTLLIAGDRDPKYVEVARAMEAQIAGARCLIVPDAGHNVHLEAPEAFALATLDHWRAMDGAGVAEPSSRS